MWTKGKTQVCPGVAVAPGKAGDSSLEGNILWLVRGAYWLSLVGSELESVTKIQEAASNVSSPGHLGPILQGCIASKAGC